MSQTSSRVIMLPAAIKPGKVSPDCLVSDTIFRWVLTSGAQHTPRELQAFRPLDELPAFFTKPFLLQDGSNTCLFPPLFWYGYPAGPDCSAVEISEKCDRLVVDVYGCGNDSPALIELGSSSHGMASREEIDKVKDTYGLINEPKWYLSRQRALWRAVR
jgi:hypothetical protein